MSHDPYTPPSSNLVVAAPVRGSAVKAVTLGMLADVLGTIVAATMAAAVYGAYLGSTGATADEIAAAAGNVNSDSAFGIILAIIGCLFSVLGGYICARIARHSEYRLGFIMFAASVVLGVVIGDKQAHPIVTVILSVASLASIMIGIYLGVQKNRAERNYGDSHEMDR